MSTDLAIAFWNRNKGADPSAQAAWLAQPRSCGCPDWDVLILAEVTRKAVASFAPIADHCITWSEMEGLNEGGRPHGVMILSRRPLAPAEVVVPPVASPAVLAQELVDHVRRQDGEWDRPRPLRRERWLVADVPYTAGERSAVIRVSGFHAPFAAGRRVWDSLQNRLTKRLAYQQLAAWAAAQRAAGVPTVVGLDGNNWSDWGRGQGPRPTPPIRRYRSSVRQRLDEAGLFDVESAFHGPDPPHGLVDTFRAAFQGGSVVDPHGSLAAASAKPSRPLALTYLLKSDGHRMDRIYGSPEIPVVAAGVCHGSLTPDEVATATKGTHLAPGSDHAFVWARLDLERVTRVEP